LAICLCYLPLYLNRNSSTETHVCIKVLTPRTVPFGFLAIAKEFSRSGSATSGSLRNAAAVTNEGNRIHRRYDAPHKNPLRSVGRAITGLPGDVPQGREKGLKARGLPPPRLFTHHARQPSSWFIEFY
jgi:hypothetical protein